MSSLSLTNSGYKMLNWFQALTMPIRLCYLYPILGLEALFQSVCKRKLASTFETKIGLHNSAKLQFSVAIYN